MMAVALVESPLESPTLSYLQIGKDVITAEADALHDLAKSLDRSFEQAITLMAKTQGRLIVSGIGKSGHIGRKITATFASTGQPALFVHPAEASHGDLGMIAKGDVLLLISYSGESKELTTIVDYCRRLSLPIISITGGEQSTLARFSSVSLVLPKVSEACPMGLAPTTSTTVTLALGDALAVALLRRRGFSKQQFHAFHPGGSLGQQLRRIADCMHQGAKIPLLHVSTLMDECLVKMTAHGFGCVGIVDDQEHLVGIITDGDLRRHMNPGLLTQTVDQIMTKNPLTISPDCLVVDALAIFEQKSITSLFVLDDTKTIVGIVHLHDCLRSHAA
ncbi:KpsF/GutQ family sugar-phosphate isomerase [Candidatus Finniella inopinata]|nr:KpsF/GutQ family sugar-phosphate isomerase [Candidatus Finniella inopinata]